MTLQWEGRERIALRGRKNQHDWQFDMGLKSEWGVGGMMLFYYFYFILLFLLLLQVSQL